MPIIINVILLRKTIPHVVSHGVCPSVVREITLVNGYTKSN